MLAVISPTGAQRASHNLVGQRLGRKGLETRERILAAMMRLLHAQRDEPITLTGVAREAVVGMSTLYLYFPDIGELQLAALARVMEGADAAFADRLRDRWCDALLGERCLDFMHAHHGFWRRHARVLHMRNSCADAGDIRFLHYRQSVSRPVLEMIVRQMDGDPGEGGGAVFDMATVVMAGFERIAAVVTNPNFHALNEAPVAWPTGVDALIAAEARLMAIAIRDCRASAAAAR